MAQIKLMNKIAKVGLDQFNKSVYELTTEADDPDGMMVRSASLHEMEFGKNLLAIARCGAGVNNIPVDECARKGIVVFNTPGANANGVKELAIAALLLASRDIIGGVEWASTLETDVAKSVEAGKSKFAGVELMGKTLGVVGLGAIGGLVANAAKSLGMNVIGYDPYITVEAAWSLSRAIQKASSYEEIFRESDYITLHVPATKDEPVDACGMPPRKHPNAHNGCHENRHHNKLNNHASHLRRSCRVGTTRQPTLYASFLPMRLRTSPTTVGTRETATMPTMRSSKCSCTKGIPPKK